jgi:hypothetical protein
MADPHALRMTSDAILRDLEALILLEEQKRQLPLNDPALVDLANQVREIADRILDQSRDQVAQTAAAVADPNIVASIASTPRTPASILAEWRELERRASAAPEGSAERTEIEILASRLRDEYRTAYDAATRKPGPEKGERR